MVLFDGGCHHAGDADAIATHEHRDRLAALVEHLGFEGLTVFAPQLKAVTDLDAAHDAQLAHTRGAGITIDHVA